MVLSTQYFWPPKHGVGNSPEDSGWVSYASVPAPSTWRSRSHEWRARSHSLSLTSATGSLYPSHSGGCAMISHRVLIGTSLLANSVECIFVCLLITVHFHGVPVNITGLSHGWVRYLLLACKSTCGLLSVCEWENTTYFNLPRDIKNSLIDSELHTT